MRILVDNCDAYDVLIETNLRFISSSKASNLIKSGDYEAPILDCEN